MMGSRIGSTTKPETAFGNLLRRWRAVRHLSQLDLALDADISTRHLSCLETGRAQPSRDMVLRLGEALQVPLRERNGLLLAAGYAPFYRCAGLDGMEADAACHAVELLMAQHEPYPVLVVDRYWNTLRMNVGAKRFLALFPGCGSVTPPLNGVRLVFHPNGLRAFIENWEDVAARLIQRVHRELAANPSDETMRCFLKELLAYPDVPSPWRMPDLDVAPPPFLTINYRWKNSTLRLFSALTTFGTALDIALQELRIGSGRLRRVRRSEPPHTSIQTRAGYHARQIRQAVKLRPAVSRQALNVAPGRAVAHREPNPEDTCRE